MLNKNSSKQTLKDMRITVKNILFVIGLPSELANKSEEELMSEEYFGQYGKILKLTKNEKPYNNKNSSPIFSIHLNYSSDRETSIAMLALNDKIIKNNKIKASFGTTKYCKNFIDDKFCYNKDCLYYHKLDVENEMNKEEIIKNKEIIYINQIKSAIYLSGVLDPIYKEYLLSKQSPVNSILPSILSVYENSYVKNELKNENFKLFNSNNPPPHKGSFSYSTNKHDSSKSMILVNNVPVNQFNYNSSNSQKFYTSNTNKQYQNFNNQMLINNINFNAPFKLYNTSQIDYNHLSTLPNSDEKASNSNDKEEGFLNKRSSKFDLLLNQNFSKKEEAFKNDNLNDLQNTRQYNSQRIPLYSKLNLKLEENDENENEIPLIVRNILDLKISSSSKNNIKLDFDDKSSTFNDFLSKENIVKFNSYNKEKKLSSLDIEFLKYLKKSNPDIN